MSETNKQPTILEKAQKAYDELNAFLVKKAAIPAMLLLVAMSAKVYASEIEIGKTAVEKLLNEGKTMATEFPKWAALEMDCQFGTNLSRPGQEVVPWGNFFGPDNITNESGALIGSVSLKSKTLFIRLPNQITVNGDRFAQSSKDSRENLILYIQQGYGFQFNSFLFGNEIQDTELGSEETGYSTVGMRFCADNLQNSAVIFSPADAYNIRFSKGDADNPLQR